jgi:hypothetical protein
VQAGQRQATLLAAALCVPGALLIVATAAMFVALPFGIDPVWHVEQVTLPEAAALRDNGEVMRLIGLGADPNEAGRVRPNFAHNEAQVLTPLEAAVGIRRADMVELLLENGARMDTATWSRLTCFADVVKAGDVRAILDERRPQDAPATCEGVRTPW